MPSKSPVDELRRQIASVISEEKAHDVPGVCVRYGLANGTGEEAFNSKFRYVMKRLQSLNTGQVLGIGQALQSDCQDARLADALAVVEDFELPKISVLTRRRLLDVINRVDVSGRLELLEFLEPAIDLDAIPSTLNPSIREHIIRHCLRNDNWDNAELFRRLGFLECHQRQAFRLLERMVDPEVRDDEDQDRVVSQLNPLLMKDGYALQVVGTMSGSSLYRVQRAGAPGETPADDEITALMQRFDEAGIHDLWQKALLRRNSDPDGAITIARTYLERTCKHILDEEGVAYPDDIDLPKLWSECAKLLSLAPSQHTEDAFKGILGSCQNVVNTLGTIRNRVGDSHGQRGRPVRPKPRHAQLAVNLAGSMAMFLLATWEEQKALRTPVAGIQPLGAGPP